MSSTIPRAGAVLVDTNVLVYAHDPRDRAQQERAIAAMEELVLGRRAVLST